jgi:hypothetical protein
MGVAIFWGTAQCGSYGGSDLAVQETSVLALFRNTNCHELAVA